MRVIEALLRRGEAAGLCKHLGYRTDEYAAVVDNTQPQAHHAPVTMLQYAGVSPASSLLARPPVFPFMSLDISLTNRDTGEEAVSMNWLRNPYGLSGRAEANWLRQESDAGWWCGPRSGNVAPCVLPVV
jgi:hypothetical protein